MPLVACAVSRAGPGRSASEDAFCVELDLGLLAVADGITGRASGGIASQLAVSALATHLRARPLPAEGGSALDALSEAVQAVNAAIQARSSAEPRCAGMGTTLTACLVRGGAGYFAHIGDSRAYLLRDGQLSRLTEDHTVAGLRAARGLASREAAGTMDRQLLAALGLAPWAGADLSRRDLCPGDLLLLCTDGLTAGVSAGELAALEHWAGTLAERAARLVALAVERGVTDDVTVVLGKIVA